LTLDRESGPRPSLLKHMGQLVCEKLPPGAVMWRIPTLREDDILPTRIRQRVDRRSGSGGSIVAVYADLSEVMSETWLEKCSGCAVKRVALRSQHVFHNRRDHTRRCSPETVHPASNERGRCAVPRRCHRGWLSHIQYLLGHAIGFFFVLIAGISDDKPVLDRFAQELAALAGFALPAQLRRTATRALPLDE